MWVLEFRHPAAGRTSGLFESRTLRRGEESTRESCVAWAGERPLEARKLISTPLEPSEVAKASLLQLAAMEWSAAGD